MLENLIFSIDRVLPFFVLILLGGFLSWRKIVSKEFFQLANKFVYGFALPINIFSTIAKRVDGVEVSPKMLGFAAGFTVLSFFVILCITKIVYRKQPELVGTLVQGGFRGNFALLGSPLAAAVGGAVAEQKAALALMVVIPIYNIFSVIILTTHGSSNSKPNIKKLILEIFKNPLILAILCALPFFAFGVEFPYFVDTTLTYISKTATPLGLLSIGGLFTLKDATARLKPALYSTSIKILILPAIMFTISVLAGFRGDELLILFVIFASPAAVSSYPMACALGGDGPLASNNLILTTLLSAFSFAIGVYILRTFSLI